MKCAYCGDIADSLDHVLPHSYTRIFPKQNRTYNKKEVVPCCTECNSLLGNKPYFAVAERAAYLAGKYEKRYKKLLSMPVWEEEDIEECGYNIKLFIENSVQEKKAIELRIDNCCLVRDIAPSIEDIQKES